MTKYVYLFREGNQNMKDLLGGKGANLAEMISIGLPVPQGFTVTTEACNDYYANHEAVREEIKSEIIQQLRELERITGKVLGSKERPLLVSVRSGAQASMPGMMDTILNLGLNDEVAEGFSKITNNKRFVYDSYRRFIQMFADVVKGYPKSSFERYLDDFKEKRGVFYDTELSEDDMIVLTSDFKKIYKNLAGVDFPSDPVEQLIEAITAVFRSWNNERAIYYRRMNDIPSSWGTAVNVQEMVYGNRGENSGTGVAFTRNPSTGENELYGEYLMNAQGEDVVAGIRTPEPISKLKEDMPQVYQEFLRYAKILENHYKDMQDMEFTIEDGKLYMLQTRNGKRTATAAIKIAVSLVQEGMISEKEALLKVEPKQLDALLHPTFSEDALKNGQVLASGLAASPGAGAGKIYFNAQEVIKHQKNGEKTILVRLETSPEDIEGMNHAEGILTIRGGMTSHAAVVARGMGKCCVSGCGSLTLNEVNKTLITDDGTVLHEGDEISLDGSTGKVYLGVLESVTPSISGDFKTFMNWADQTRRLKIRCNADTPKDALVARDFGAEGIGLVRTEHMFFDHERIFNFRKMIVSDTKEEREKMLEAILPYQRSDFEALFKVMAPYPVVIRYLDPPLHEFLPKEKNEVETLAHSLNLTYDELQKRIDALKEFNPMMGHRGCRLAITYPEIAKMQTQAVIEAAIQVNKEGLNVVPEIMIPLTCAIKEYKYVKEIVVETAEAIIKNFGVDLKYQVGTMIELPRATIIADEIAKDAEFFSFGSNDLTQMIYGFSRDDAGKFLEDYYKKGLFDSDPFARIDEIGVGSMIKMAIEKGKSVRADIELGICGEHGGDPASIAFCDKIGLNYVSCSPFRVPVARLAAAQAAIRENVNK
ncbi:MAG: pyruvate, phosphate dikinase [Bacilli bacterium]|nr:pyruvate, phosphate dikinase [Bacilli bacterium]